MGVLFGMFARCRVRRRFGVEYVVWEVVECVVLVIFFFCVFNIDVLCNLNL